MVILARVHTTQLSDPTSGLDSGNCTAAVGATAVRWHYRNVRPTPDPELRWPPTAGNVRALIVESDGDPDTLGGTSLPQVAEAIKLGWDVDMAEFRGLDFDAAWEMAQDPENFVPVQFQYVVLDGTRFDAGGVFLGAHAGGIANASAVAADFTDPLADGRRPGIPSGVQRIPRSLLKEACGELVVNRKTGARAGIGKAWCGLVVASPQPVIADAGDVMFDVAPASTYRDAVLKAGTVLYRDGALTKRQSAITAETRLGFLGSTATAHVVVNAGKTNYVRRADVLRKVANTRSFE